MFFLFQIFLLCFPPWLPLILFYLFILFIFYFIWRGNYRLGGQGDVLGVDKIIESPITTTMQCDIGLMWQVLIYPVAICISSLFHEGAYWITSKWRLWNIKRLLLCGVAVSHSGFIMLYFHIKQNNDMHPRRETLSLDAWTFWHVDLEILRRSMISCNNRLYLRNIYFHVNKSTLKIL